MKYDFDSKELYDLYLSGKSCRAIARIFNCSENPIRRILETNYGKIFRQTNIKRKCNDNFFENIDSEEKAYWLGFIAADGNVSKKYNKLQILLNIIDIEHINKFIKSIDGDYCAWKVHGGRHAHTHVSSAKMVQDLGKYGIIPNKTKILEYSNNIDNDLIRHYIRGYFDGDGCLYFYEKKECGYTYICGTYKFLDILMNKFIDILNLQKIKIVKRPGVWVLKYGGNHNVYKICNFLYENSNIYLDRKYTKYLEFKKFYENKYKDIL